MSVTSSVKSAALPERIVLPSPFGSKSETFRVGHGDDWVPFEPMTDRFAL